MKDFPGLTRLPDGYVALAAGGRQAVARAWSAPAIAAILAGATLHDWAAAREAREEMSGRGVSYGVSLPAGTEGAGETAVVVRHNRHGGLLRHLTGDLFRLPTRAPLELEIARRLAGQGIPTPEVIAYALYPAGIGFARCDVITRRLPAGSDFPEAWQAADRCGRHQLLTAAARLVRALDACGAWHRDLNLKNIYVSSAHGPTAFLLDVDRVEFHPPAAMAGRNLARLARSARKWISRRGLDMGSGDLEQLTSLIQEVA